MLKSTLKTTTCKTTTPPGTILCGMSSENNEEGKGKHDGGSNNSVDSSNVCLVPSGIHALKDKDGVSLSSESSSISSESATAEADGGVRCYNNNNNNKTHKNDTVDLILPNLHGDKNTRDVDALVFGSPDTPLYKSMMRLTLVTTTEKKEEEGSDGDHYSHQQQHRRICTPSAAKAEELSTNLRDQVNNLVTKEGNTEQRNLWHDATIEQQDEWIASFFFLSSLSSKPISSSSIINDNTNDGVGIGNDNNNDGKKDGNNDGITSDDDNSSDSSDDWGKEELVFPPATAAAGGGPNDIDNQQLSNTFNDGGDDYWASTIETQTDTNNGKEKTMVANSSHNTTDQHDHQRQQDLFLVDMTQIDSSIHCKFDKNGVNDVSSMRHLRRTIEDKYESYRRDTSLLADATIIPCSVGVWQPALVRLREERPGHYICPIFRPKNKK